MSEVLEIHRRVCAEQCCDPENITGIVARYAAERVAHEDDKLGDWLREGACDMDRPVSLNDIEQSLEEYFSL